MKQDELMTEALEKNYKSNQKNIKLVDFNRNVNKTVGILAFLTYRQKRKKNRHLKFK